MPLYEYRCESCSERFEELVSASAAEAPPCPACGAAGARRLFSTFATEWLPSNVAWHRLPGKHDLGGAPDSRPTASIPKAIPDGKGKQAGKGGKKRA
ncbi:MAG TPA: zinc ribbon domain-containing protein [Gaiellaceae bacterium]|nr:zinc ribbon domain-containing protein [Gaiellaceae bacterium]